MFFGTCTYIIEGDLKICHRAYYSIIKKNYLKRLYLLILLILVVFPVKIFYFAISCREKEITISFKLYFMTRENCFQQFQPVLRGITNAISLE